MKVYLIQAGEWETDVRCVCSTEEKAIKKCIEIAKEYGFEEDTYEEIKDMICYTMYEVEE